ncbi:DinB family protein [Pilimelia columellifera]
MTANAPLAAEERVSTAGEREVLEAFIDYFRQVIVSKLAGLSDDDVRRRLVPSRTTLIGLVKHAAAVERGWFHHRLAQRPREQIGANSLGDDASWDVTADEAITDVVAEYAEACTESREIAARFALDDTVPHHRLGRVSLRWIYVHMIEEMARHAGHADILREQIDGATGD